MIKWGFFIEFVSRTWSKSLKHGIHPVISAQRHVLMSPQYTTYIHTPVPGVSKPAAQWWTSPPWDAVGWHNRLVPIRFWRIGRGRAVTHTAHISGWRIVLSQRSKILGSGHQHTKQFAHNCHLPYIQHISLTIVTLIIWFTITASHE